MFQTPFQPILADVLAEEGFVLGVPQYRADLVREYWQHERNRSPEDRELEQKIHDMRQRDPEADEMLRQLHALWGNGPDLYMRVMPNPGDSIVVRRQSCERDGVLVTHDILLNGPRPTLNRATSQDIEKLLAERSDITEEFGVFTKEGDAWHYVDAIIAEPGKMFYSFHEKGAQYDLHGMCSIAMAILAESQD